MGNNTIELGHKKNPATCANRSGAMAIVGKDDHMLNATQKARAKRGQAPEKTFSQFTERQGDCLIWTGARSANGYGYIRVNGKHVGVHRWAYERSRGTIPNGHVIDHLCRNPLCCEVTHLRLATRKQNGEHLAIEGTSEANPYRGVSFDKATGRWGVRVMHNRKAYWGGRHATRDEAAAVAKALRNQLFTHNDLDRTTSA